MKRVTGVYGTKVRIHLRTLEINECPLCGSNEGVDVGEVCSMPEIGPSAQVVQGPTGAEIGRSNLSVVPAMCLHCGYQFLFNSVKLGIGHGYRIR